jgi:hypothetical protein
MKVLGYIFLAILGVGVVGALVLGVVSVPDIKRYLKIRSM